MESNKVKEIKRLLKLHFIADSKIEYSYNNLGVGKVVNKMQQAAATRIYRMATKVDTSISSVNFVKLYNEANEEMKIENSEIYNKRYNNGF
jgi:hypothetical protein